MLLHPPAAGLVAEPASANCGGWKVPSPLLSATHTPVIPAEPDDVRSVRPRYVSEEPRMLGPVCQPPACEAKPGPRPPVLT